MKKIIQDVLRAQDEKSEFNSYAILIMRLEAMENF